MFLVLISVETQDQANRVERAAIQTGLPNAVTHLDVGDNVLAQCAERLQPLVTKVADAPIAEQLAEREVANRQKPDAPTTQPAPQRAKPPRP